MSAKPGPSRAHLTALFVLSAGTLAFEVLLLRLFEYSHWHHFAGLAIALALLGLGAAGTVLALLGRSTIAVADGLFIGAILAAAIGLVLVIVVQSQVALRPVIAGWDTLELARLLLVDTVAFVPFLGAGLAIGHAFVRWPQQIRRVYAANLLGSGAGSAAASLALVVMGVDTAIALASVVLAMTALGLAMARRRPGWALAATLVTAGTVAVATDPPSPAVSDFKPLAQLLNLPDVRVLADEAGLRGRLTALHSDSLRVAPGLSLRWQSAVPASDAIVVGSGRVVALPRTWPGPADHVRASLAGLPLVLRPGADVLAIGAGTWGPTGRHDAASLTWVEPDARILAAARERRAGGAQLQAVADSAYHHLASDGPNYDVIAIDRAYDGGDAASEDYLLTAQGLRLALSRLNPRGLLAIPLPLHYPPRHYPRVLNTVRAALTSKGAFAPGEHVAALRGLRAMLLLVSSTPLAADDLRALRTFADSWAFDLAWLPDLKPAETNRHHLLDTAAFFDAARTVFNASNAPSPATWYITDAAHQARPYPWRSMRWSQIPAFLKELGQRGWSYLDWTLLFSLATTVVVSVLAFFLILAPLGRLPRAPESLGRRSVVVYFAALGLGYMLLEFAIFQRSILFLGEPVLSASVVFAAFLIGSGAGSATAPRLCRRRTVVLVFAPLGVAAMIAMAGLWGVTKTIMPLPLLARIAIIVLFVGPLAFALGRPLPWALHQLAGVERWVPWAWGISGFASVFAASAATLLSVQAGQPATLLAGACCYLVALAVAMHWTPARR
jgi:hypothetical protein